MKKYGLFILFLCGMLRMAAESADHMLLHFWDDMEWADSTLTSDEVLMGQKFANFVSVIPQATEQVRTAAVDTLLTRAAATPAAAEALSYIAETYLLGRRSPVRSDSLYAAMADGMVALHYPGAFRIAALADMARRNAPGSYAPDFEMVLRSDGQRHSLHELIAGQKVILIFYDPDCHNCAEAIAALDASATLSYRLIKNEIAVVAVYSGDDTELWTASAGKIPAGWHDGIDGGDVFDNELYIIPETPTLYLIDSDGRIVLKDATVEEILDNIK